jgi:Nitrile hydratase, alpha chain
MSSSPSTPRRTQIEALLLQRAATDADFRNLLLDHPKSALAREFGLDIPADVHITVLQETPNQHYVVLPPEPTPADSSTDTGLIRLVKNRPIAY